MRKHSRDLKRPDQPKPGHVGGRNGGDIAALVDNSATARAKEFCEKVEAGGLAGAVRANERVNGPASDPKVYSIDGDKAGELLGEIFGFKDELVTHGQFPDSAGALIARPRRDSTGDSTKS